MLPVGANSRDGFLASLIVIYCTDTLVNSASCCFCVCQIFKVDHGKDYPVYEISYTKAMIDIRHSMSQS